MKRKYMKWKDNELRMQVGLVVTHTDDDLLFMKSEKYANTLDALQAFAELVRQDEREACAKLCEENMFYATGEQHAKAIRVMENT